MSDKQPVSIIVPTLNESANMKPLLERTDRSLRAAGIEYEVIVIDDHSSDSTVSTIRTLGKRFPVRVALKRGKRGKAYSLLQGFAESKYNLVAMIDADLQYAPEELVPMYSLLTTNKADVVVTNRREQQTPLVRKLGTKIFSFVFSRLLFGIAFDTQSGLKLFRKQVLRSFDMTPSPWSFDLEFIVRSLENNYKILSHDIAFGERTAGVTKVKLLHTTFELMSASLKLRLRTSFRKLRAGYQANNIFLKRAVSITALVLTATMVISASSSFKASALSTPDVTSTPVSAVVDSVVTPITSLLPNTSTTSGTAPTSATTTATQPVTTLFPIVPTTSGASTTTDSTTPVADSAQDNLPAVSFTPGTIPSPATLAANPQSSVMLDNSKLIAVTSSTAKGVYGAGFMKPNSAIVRFVRELAVGGLIVGIVILLSVIGSSAKTGYTRYKAQQI